jgi:nucleoside-diphosphate-sugar epimerase
MKILITAINNPLANAVAETLEGHEIIGLGRREHPRYRTILCDLRDELPTLPAMDVCLHLACVSNLQVCKERPEEAYRVNVSATSELLGCASRFVYASTGSVYGFRDGLVDEATEPKPEDEYASLKFQAEKVVLRHPHAVVLRYFFAYGPSTRSSSLVNRLIGNIHAGRELDLHNDDRPRINPVYLADLAAATRLFCLEHLEGVYNVAGSEIITIRELAEMIGNVLGKCPRFRRSGRKIKDLAASTDKLASVFKPSMKLADGIQRTVAQWGREAA